MDDDSVMLSVAAVRKAIAANQAQSMSALVDFATADSPRKASSLLQDFARSTVDRNEQVDDVTKERLKEIAAQLTNNTWMSLEQAHRRDQDRINMHWRAIKECGDAHIRHMQQDVDSLEVQQVRTHESDMIRCRGLPNHTNPFAISNANLLQKSAKQHGDVETPADYDTTAWLDNTPFAIGEDGQRYFKHTSAYYDDPNHKSLLELKNEVCKKCGELDEFLKNLPKARPACDAPLVGKEMTPRCGDLGAKPLVDSDLDEYFDNLRTFANYNLGRWEELKANCDNARQLYKDEDERCDEEQHQYENSFCAYRQGLHETCATYQGCHILSEEEYMKLINDVLYAADSRKIDWKAIHKIACYIKVLVEDGTNEERTIALNNCESGDLNTLATILTGFNETNYLSIIVPDISGNVSCWDLEVPPLIDFKECDMSSVSEYPCTATWSKRYEGLESPTHCIECAPLPASMQYYLDQEEIKNTRLDSFGGGWIFVNEIGRSVEDLHDIAEIQPDGYMLPSYNMKGLRWNEVLIRRVSANWCDSWGRKTGKWAEEGGASMCVQSDNDHVYCMNNHNGGHSWRQQPVSHFAALCGKHGLPDCECWPYREGQEKLCFTYGDDIINEAAAMNVEAPHHVQIHSMSEDGSVVKVQFHGEEKVGVLRVGAYGSFLDGVGCGSVTPVKYQVFVRCLGCTTERSDFHTKDGAQFNGAMTVGQMATTVRATYTYEGWFRSPLEGKFTREMFGGSTSGLVLVNDGKVKCETWGSGANERTHYQVHVGNTNKYSSACFMKNLFYHVAVTRGLDGEVKVYVNGRQVTATNEGGEVSNSELSRTFGSGFTDGGQLFNVRIWDHARSQADVLEYSAVTNPVLMDDLAGLDHWWPLTDDTKDIITGAELQGPEVRYSPIWCSDLEASGMRVC